MKINLFKLFITFTILFFSTLSFASSKDGDFYFGYSEIPITITGLENVQLSDWEEWTSFADARVYLPLSDGNRDGLGQGLNIGFKTRGFIPVLLELQIFPDNGIITNFLLGLKVNIINTNVFKFSFSPKIGPSLFYKSLGELTEIDNAYSYVDLDGIRGLSTDDPRVGDEISASMIGFVSQLSADFQINFTKKLGFILSAGYSESSFSTLSFMIDRDGVPITIEYDDPAIVVNDINSIESANLNPDIKSIGQYIASSLVLSF